MSRCYKIKNLFGSYIYNTITSEEKAEVEEHIKTCPKCAEDLRTQQGTLTMIKLPQRLDDSVLQLDEDRFMWNVYRRIASESMKHRSREITIRKFVLQPAVATVAIVFIVALAVTRFDNMQPSDNAFYPVVSNTTINLPKIDEMKEPVQIAINKESVQKEIDKPAKKLVVKTPTIVKKKTENVAQARSNFLVNEVRVSNSRDWLMNADLINYSLGQPLKALSKYQMIVEHYPDTDAAKEAQKRINTILNSEFESHVKEIAFETESNSGI